MDPLETCLAQLFKRKGKGVLTEKEFVFSASIDFRWFTPKDAQRLLEEGVRRGLLTLTDSLVKPSFDYKAVEVPPDFRPSPKMLDEIKEEAPLFARILEIAARASGLPKREVVARINGVQERLGVDVEVAGLIVARGFGVNVQELIDPVQEEILRR